MALTPLATIADITARGVTVAANEEPVVTAALDAASAAVRAAAGSTISEHTDTVTLAGTCSPRLALPGAPVTAVSEVLVDGEPVSDYRLSGGVLWRSAGWQSGPEPSEVTVTYTHGLPVVPADVVDLVCRLAVSVLLDYRKAPTSGGLTTKRVQSEKVGEYTVNYTGSWRISEHDLPDYVRARLAARFGGGAPVAVRSR